MASVTSTEEDTLNEETHDTSTDKSGEEETGEGQEEEDDTEKDEFPSNPLDRKLIRESLSDLARIGQGLSHAYVRLDLHNRELTDITLLTGYIHLRFLDISENHIKDVSPVSSLTALLWLSADHNALSEIDMEELPHLQTATFRDNRITSVAAISHPMLSTLSLAANQIEWLDWSDVSRLQLLTVLDLKDNRLTSMDGLLPPNLQELYLAGNELTDVLGLEMLTKLRILHLRSNQLSNLEGFPKLDALEYLNLRANDISEFTQLSNLGHLKRLRVLVLKDNAVAKLDDYRVQVIVKLIDSPVLRRLDKITCTSTERREAREWIEEMEGEDEVEEEEEDVEEEEELIFDTTADTNEDE